MRQPSFWLAWVALLLLSLLSACGRHTSTAAPSVPAALPAPQLDGWSMPRLPATDAPQPSDPAEVRSRLAQFNTPLPATTREASGVIKHLPDDSLTVHNTYPNPGFYDFRVSTPFDAQTPSPLNIRGSLTFSGPLTGRFVQVGLVNNATYNYALDPDGDPNTNDANPSYLFNQNVVMVCALDTAGRPFAAPLDYNNSGGIGQGQAISGNLLTFNLKLQPSGSTGGTVALSVNNGAFGPAIVYGKNNWGWQPDESFAQARLVAQVYSYNPDPTPFTVSFKNVLADDPNYTPPVPTTDWVHTWGTSNAQEVLGLATGPGGVIDLVGVSYGASTAAPGYGLLEQYAADGSLNWVRLWAASSFDILSNTAVDSSGNIYAGGRGIGSGMNNGYQLLKLNSAGQLLWSRKVNCPGRIVQNSSLALDAGQNCYVLLNSASAAGTDFGTCLVKLDPSGTLLKETNFGLIAEDVSVSGTDVFLFAAENATAANYHLVVMRLDQSLKLLDERKLIGFTPGISAPSVWPGVQGRLLIAASALDTGATYLLNLDLAHNSLVWQRQINMDHEQWCRRLATDAAGDIFLSGTVDIWAEHPHAYIAALDQFGTLLDAQQWSQPITPGLEAGLATTPDGSVYLGGYAANAYGLTWSALRTSVSTPAIAVQSAANETPLAPQATLTSLSGSLSLPVGVQDTGGGDEDALLVRHQLPNVPHGGGGPNLGPLQLDCTALPNARFTVWDPTGPTPYTGSLSTNSVFDASHTLYDGDQFYLSFDVDPALAPDDLAVYPPRPDGAAGGYVTVTPSGLALDPRLATWFTVPSGTNTLQLKTAAYSRVTNDLALGLPNALYTLRDTGTNATIGGPWETDQSSFQHILLANTLNFRPVFSPRAYPLAGSSSAHGGAPETIYPNEWTLNWFNLTDGTLTEQGDNSTPSMRDYFTQSGLTNKLDKDAFVRIDCAASGVLHAPYDFELSPGFPGVTPFLSQLAQPQDVVTFARGQSLRCRDSNSSFSAPLLAVQANHRLNGSNSVTVTFNNGGGPLALTYLPTRVWDDPEASDPDANVAGSGPWTVGLGFAVQYGTGPWTVELDADYGSAWNDGTPGRVYTLSGSPFAASGLQHVNQTIPGTQPRGTYKFALRVTDIQGRQYVYVWPNPVTLP